MLLNLSSRFDPALADFLDETVVPILRYIFPRGTLRILSDRAYEECAAYAYEHMTHSLAFKRVEELRLFAFNARPVDGLIVEFGVWKGTSINFLSGHTKDKLFGFDSFHGLKEHWRGTKLAAGHFSLDGRLPTVRANVELVPGWFDESLPLFLSRTNGNFAFVHIDCDTFEAAQTVFSLAGDRFVSGTVVLFDEYFGYRGWRHGEFKAWQEFVSDRNLKYEYIAFSNDQVAVRIVE